MQITAKYASYCPECGGAIERGERIEWVRGAAARHIVCPASPASVAEEDYRETLAQEDADDAEVEVEVASAVAKIAAAWPRIASGECSVLQMRQVASVEGFARANDFDLFITREVEGRKVAVIRDWEAKATLIACVYRPGEFRVVTML